jgi:hypothetical protein
MLVDGGEDFGQRHDVPLRKAALQGVALHHLQGGRCDPELSVRHDLQMRVSTLASIAVGDLVLPLQCGLESFEHRLGIGEITKTGPFEQLGLFQTPAFPADQIVIQRAVLVGTDQVQVSRLDGAGDVQEEEGLVER